MRSFLLLCSGICIGFWISWPGILIPNNWKCFKDIIAKSTNEKISLKAVLAVSPNYLLKGQKNNIASKIRIVSDACFR
jgi:hypothetical protein